MHRWAAVAGHMHCPQSGNTDDAAADSGRKTLVGISEPNAWPNARIRMTYPATGAPTIVACSTDNFAIRPASFGSVAASDLTEHHCGAPRALANVVVTGGNVHKAGSPSRFLQPRTMRPLPRQPIMSVRPPPVWSRAFCRFGVRPGHAGGRHLVDRVRYCNDHQCQRIPEVGRLFHETGGQHLCCGGLGRRLHRD